MSHLEKNRERERKDARVWRARLKRELVDAYGGKCACCGESEIEFLTLDHINGDGAEERRRLGGRCWAGPTFYSYLKKLGWPKGDYQILCYNCNCAKRQSKICPHQRLKAVTS